MTRTSYDFLWLLGALHEIVVHHRDPQDPFGLFWHLGLSDEEERQRAIHRGIISKNAEGNWDLAKAAAWETASTHKKAIVRSTGPKLTAVATWRERDQFSIAAAARSKKRAEEILNFLCDVWDSKYGHCEYEDTNKVRFLFLALVLHYSLPES